MDMAPFAMCSIVCVMADDWQVTEEGRSSSLLMPQESSGPSSSSDNGHHAAVRIWDQLRARTQSDLIRKRKINELLDCFPVFIYVFV